jgi:large subunit ribosomal protein L5
MLFALKKNKKRSEFFRCFFYSNLHKIPSNIESIQLSYLAQKDITLKILVRFAAFLEIISSNRPIFLRAKKVSLISKIRKGMPIGVIVDIRKKKLFKFLNLLIYNILPNITQSKKKEIKKTFCFKAKNFHLRLDNPFLFPIVQNFYSLFKSCLNLRMCIHFAEGKSELFFHLRFLRLSF